MARLKAITVAGVYQFICNLLNKLRFKKNLICFCTRTEVEAEVVKELIKCDLRH
jgi:hypothetical protein